MMVHTSLPVCGSRDTLPLQQPHSFISSISSVMRTGLLKLALRSASQREKMLHTLPPNWRHLTNLMITLLLELYPESRSYSVLSSIIIESQTLLRTLTSQREKKKASALASPRSPSSSSLRGACSGADMPKSISSSCSSASISLLASASRPYSSLHLECAETLSDSSLHHQALFSSPSLAGKLHERKDSLSVLTFRFCEELHAVAFRALRKGCEGKILPSDLVNVAAVVASIELELVSVFTFFNDCGVATKSLAAHISALCAMLGNEQRLSEWLSNPSSMNSVRRIHTALDVFLQQTEAA